MSLARSFRTAALGACVLTQAGAAAALPGWEAATIGGCLPAIESGRPFSAAGLRPLAEPVVAPEHREWPAASWQGGAGRFVVTMIEFPARTGGSRRSCDVRASGFVPGETVLAVFGRFLDWGTAAANADRYKFEDTRRQRDPYTAFGALRSVAANPRGCRVSVSLLAMPAEGVLSFSAGEIAAPGCGGPSLLPETPR
jgi:hypothetical protein